MLAAPVGPRPGRGCQKSQAGGTARRQARDSDPREGFGWPQAVARGRQPPEPAPRAAALRRTALPRRDAPRFCGISGLRRRRPPGRRSSSAGLRHRPPARPPPSARRRPSAVSIWDPQQVRGNKAPGLVPTEGARGSPRGRGIVDHIGSTFPSPSDGIEDQVTVTARKGPTRVLGSDVQTWRPPEVAGCFRT